ncbi:MAG: hypothetical protein CBB68_11345 [Rhodospirillaceae bacterium TMED8]|nr:RNA pseudouridine synthase [Magnetovibrio sp.]OUT49596.1 MAG: hypothetical protein CBB68_11345 [Rhodospirillaceae bacterium TMED8]|tara:strand:+ start:352 stop:1344 length:993 start_codon:yes stop_codon:yes gene_type:complete
MSSTQIITVEEDDEDVRLDRWFKKHFPQITHSRLQKWLRTGQIRVDGGRVRSGYRVKYGEMVRIPPLETDSFSLKKSPRGTRSRVDLSITRELQKSILYRDNEIIILNKPAGLSVQGGSGVREHLDKYLPELRFEYSQRPKLVHRLDKDTSGGIILARTDQAARWLTKAFRERKIRKVYWAVTVGVPEVDTGEINANLITGQNKHFEKSILIENGDGQTALTRYATVACASKLVSWLVLEPFTGRKHQLRVHTSSILGTPILGDGKYGGKLAFLQTDAVSRQLHLHARGVLLTKPSGEKIEVYADIPDHIEKTFQFFGFEKGQCNFTFLN